MRRLSNGKLDLLPKFEPYVAVENRRGQVFVRVVYRGLSGRTSKVIEMTPTQATLIAGAINDAADHKASGRWRSPKVKVTGAG